MCSDDNDGHHFVEGERIFVCCWEHLPEKLLFPFWLHLPYNRDNKTGLISNFYFNHLGLFSRSAYCWGWLIPNLFFPRFILRQKLVTFLAHTRKTILRCLSLFIVFCLSLFMRSAYFWGRLISNFFFKISAYFRGTIIRNIWFAQIFFFIKKYKIP